MCKIINRDEKWREVSRRQDAKGTAKYGPYNPRDGRDNLEEAAEESYDLTVYYKQELEWMKDIEEMVRREWGTLTPPEREDFDSLIHAYKEELEGVKADSAAIFGKNVQLMNFRERWLDIVRRYHVLPMDKGHES